MILQPSNLEGGRGGMVAAALYVLFSLCGTSTFPSNSLKLAFFVWHHGLYYAAILMPFFAIKKKIYSYFEYEN